VDSDLSLYRAILDSAGDAIYAVDCARNILYWNAAAEAITGYSAEEMVGRHCFDNILGHVDDQGRQLCTSGCPLSASIADGTAREAFVYLRHRRGHRVPVRVKVSPIRDGNGEITGAVEIFSDSSASAAVHDKIRELERLAMLDPLTQVPNRRYFNSNIAKQFDDMTNAGVRFGVIMIDIDEFKQVNDQHGHQVGDEVLKVVANTLSANMRPHDVVGRWGGEEFVALIRGVSADELRMVAERLRALVEASAYPKEQGPVSVTISVGTAMARQGQNAEEIIAAADRAMYSSKRSGRNRVSTA
jgi:diguanylate cyclase (GGDEF)-like protein/PAS domain S-box-containing protein